ncbi:MAG: hypothetical protein ABI488_25350 [Polyangiaceae bacterium]
MSGYAGDVLTSTGGLDGDVVLEPEPFTPDMLRDGARKALRG